MAKVFRRESDMEKELEFAKVLQEVDPAQKFFLYPIAHCATNVGEVRKDRDATKCSYVQDAVQNSTHMLYMVTMVKGGSTVEDHVMKHRLTPAEFVAVITPVFEAVRKLSKHGYVHHDLKFDNMLYNDAHKKTHVIDFGLMQRMKTLFHPDNNRYIFSNYWLHPPEYRIAQRLYDKPLYHPTKDDFRSDVESIGETLDIYFDDSAPTTLRDLIIQQVFNNRICEYEEEYINYASSIWRAKGSKTRAMYKHADKVDIYSIGITIVYLSQFLEFPSNLARAEWMQKLKIFVHPDPRKRPGPTKAIKVLFAAV
jgi:serine/threonine protein kinase